MRKIFESESAWLIAPYAAWMVLMMCLPSAPWAYSVRTAVTLVLLAVSYFVFRKISTPQFFTLNSSFFTSLFCGIAIGVAVLFIWIAPDQFDWYRKFCVIGDPYANAKALPLDSAFTWIQLFGSACVISVAEELFFRKWLIRYAGFGWMVALFAIEHNRPVVAAICGVLYGLLYLKKGLFAAIVAHATTNLALGLFVIQYNRWEFW